MTNCQRQKRADGLSNRDRQNWREKKDRKCKRGNDTCQKIGKIKHKVDNQKP